MAITFFRNYVLPASSSNRFGGKPKSSAVAVSRYDAYRAGVAGGGRNIGKYVIRRAIADIPTEK